jgi:hypothetical protein
MTIKQQGGIFGRNPSFNDLEAEQATVNGQVNIKSNRPQIFLHEIDRTDNNARIEVTGDLLRFSQVDDANSNVVPRVTLEMDTGNFTVNDGNLVIGTSGKGIDFSATDGTGTSELFDDYEEGSWSPVVNAYSGTPTTSGYYTKIGQQVTLEGSVQLDGTSDASVVRFSDLPFTVASPYIGGAYLTYNSGGVADVIVNIDSSSRLELRNSSGTQLSFNTIGVSALLTFVVSYRAA